MVYFFQVVLLFSIENVKCWPILANLGYLARVYALFTKLTNMRYAFDLNSTLGVVVDHPFVMIPENILRLAWRRFWELETYFWKVCWKTGGQGMIQIKICSPLELKIDFHQGFEWWCLPDLWHRWVRWGTLHPRGTPHHPEHICKLNIWHFTILGTFIRDFGIHHHYHPWFPSQICKHKYGYFKVNLVPNVFRLSYCWRDIDKIQMQSWLL